MANLMLFWHPIYIILSVRLQLAVLGCSGITTGGGGGKSSPGHFSTGYFCWPTGKREARKKGEMEKKRRTIEKKKKKMRGPFCFLFCFVLFFLFVFFFCFSLLKTTEICVGSTKMGIFYRENTFHAGKKIWKNDFALSEKYSSYASAWL